MTDVRYGVIGTGMMGVEHIENINALDGAIVTAVSDPNPGSRLSGQEAASISSRASFADHKELLGSGLVDAVVVASPNFTHAEIVMDVIDSGLHFLTEKPLATTVEDAQRVVDAAQGYSGVAWMGLEYRYKPPIAKLVEEVGTGTVGTPKMVFIREHRFPFLEKVDNWNRFSENTGGTLVEKCCHFFDLMNLVTPGHPVRVLASGAQDVNHLDESYEGAVPDILDNAFVIVEYSSGARACLDLCMFAEACRNEQELSVTGDVAKVEAFVPEGFIRISHRDGAPWEEIAVDDSHIAYTGLHEGSSYLEHVDFHRAIVDGLPASVTLEDGLLSVAMGIAGHMSIDEGRPVLMSELLPERS
ncbi:MAG: Gfo/Idh/MocA family protein [Acidimicrobiia bacterium]